MKENWTGLPPEASAGPAGEAQFGLREILGLLRRRLLLILTCLIVCLVFGGLAIFALTPVYTASALIFVDPSKKNLLDPETQLTGSSSDSARVDSEVELVKSEGTLAQVATELQLANDPEFAPKLGLKDTILSLLRIAEPKLPTGQQAADQVMGKLRQAVTVQRRGLTFLISVQASSTRPERAAEIANAVARAYIVEQLEMKRLAIETYTTVLSRGLEQARMIVNDSEADFDVFLEENIDQISASTGNADLASLYDRLEELRRSNQLSAEALSKAESGLRTRNWEEVTSALQTQSIAALDQQRRELMERLSGAADEEVAAVALREELQQLDEQLNERARAALTDIRQQLMVSEAQETDTRSQIQSAMLNSRLPSEMQTRIFELLEGAQIARTQYQALLSRQRDVAMEAGLQVADGRLASIATPPSQPSFPNTRLILVLAGLAGLGLGVALAFVVENFVGGFTSEDQLRTLLRIPVIATVPKQKVPRKGVGDGDATLADAMVVAPLTMFPEAIRRVRIGIERAVRGTRPPGENRNGLVVVVTSAAPNEGKTTIALSLARAFALSGNSTILIDCDLRKPGINRQLGVAPSSGLLEYLSSRNGTGPELQSIVTVDAASGAQVILGARRSDVPTDQLVAGSAFNELMAAAKKLFSVVILDTPPVGPVVDGLHLAGLSDVTVYVVKWSSTPQQEVRHAVDSLLSAVPDNVPLLAVLNQQDNARSPYRGRYSGYYSEA